MARTPEPTEIPLPPAGGRYRWDATRGQWARLDEEGNPLAGDVAPAALEAAPEIPSTNTAQE